MTNAPTAPSAGNGPWRILILDRDPADPKWILATVAAPDDVRPAGAEEEPGEMTAAWVAARLGHARFVAFAPLPGALAWRVDGPGR
jgi:hypothetical protein